MVALINAYTGVMTALLTVPKLEPIANTLEEAVVQGRLITMQKDTPTSRNILVSVQINWSEYYGLKSFFTEKI